MDEAKDEATDKTTWDDQQVIESGDLVEDEESPVERCLAIAQYIASRLIWYHNKFVLQDCWTDEEAT